VRYVDSNSLHYWVSNIATAYRDRERLRFRLLSRFQKVLNALIAIFMVLAVVVAAIDLYVGGIPTIAHDSAAALQASTQVSKVTLISLAVLPLLHPIVDVVNWQRIAAFEKERDWTYFAESKWTASFKSFYAIYAVEVPLVRVLICLFGAIAGLTLATPDGRDVGRAFIAHLVAQENFAATTVLSFLLLSLFAMAVSTMSSLFAASLCTVHYDILPMFYSKSMSAQTRATDNAQAIRWTMIAGAGLGFAVFAAFYVADAGLKITFASASFLVLVFGFSSFQLSFVPLVLGPLIAGSGGRGTVSPGWALAIMGVSTAVAIGTTAAYLATQYDLLLSVVVPGSLGSGALLFLLARLWPRQTQAAT
jgi:hypothetical protein